MNNEMLASRVSSPEEAISVIAENMLRIRPKAEVTYHPYRKNGIYYDKHLDLRTIDLKKLYPEAKKGDHVYIDTVIEACCETDAKINFIGNAKVIYGGRVIFDTLTDISDDGKCRCPLHLKEGRNPVRFLVRCVNDSEWVFKFMPSVRWYWIWAKCYLLSARATSPLPEYEGEDGVGISRLYESEEPFDGVYAYPVPEVFGNSIDLASIFEGSVGKYAFALTYALEDTELRLCSDTELCVTVNGKEKSSPLMLKKGDEVLIRVTRGNVFSFDFSGERIGIPFLKSSRGSGDRWLTLGTFDTPEMIKPQLESPYDSADGKAFWKLSGKDDYVRPYLSSRFFGQWHYTVMVGSFGLLNASKCVGNNKYMDYYCEHMKLMITYFDYMRYEHEHFSSPSFLDISSTLHDLDSIGSIGRNLCEYYFLTGDEAAIPVIDTMLEAVKTNIPRFSDGTFHREKDMWADDTFMSCPFLTRAGILKKNISYHEEVIRQLLGFKRRLWMEDKHIFSHIFFLDTQKPNRIPWGRGNGWVFVSASDALENISEDTEGYGELLDTYKEFARGLCALQDENGLLHQVLDRHDSYSETSCTAMLIVGLCRGIRNGWLDASYKDNVIKAYNGLIGNKIRHDGTVLDVCMGSGNSTDVGYYMSLGTVENDDHGTGVILTALSEMVKAKIFE